MVRTRTGPSNLPAQGMKVRPPATKFGPGTPTTPIVHNRPKPVGHDLEGPSLSKALRSRNFANNALMKGQGNVWFQTTRSGRLRQVGNRLSSGIRRRVDEAIEPGTGLRFGR